METATCAVCVQVDNETLMVGFDPHKTIGDLCRTVEHTFKDLFGRDVRIHFLRNGKGIVLSNALLASAVILKDELLYAKIEGEPNHTKRTREDTLSSNEDEPRVQKRQRLVEHAMPPLESPHAASPTSPISHLSALDASDVELFASSHIPPVPQSEADSRMLGTKRTETFCRWCHHSLPSRKHKKREGKRACDLCPNGECSPCPGFERCARLRFATIHGVKDLSKYKHLLPEEDRRIVELREAKSRTPERRRGRIRLRDTATTSQPTAEPTAGEMQSSIFINKVFSELVAQGYDNVKAMQTAIARWRYAEENPKCKKKRTSEDTSAGTLPHEGIAVDADTAAAAELHGSASALAIGEAGLVEHEGELVEGEDEEDEVVEEDETAAVRETSAIS